jgi:hypothetical protein
MFALPPKADIRRHVYDVRFVPKADISFAYATALVGANRGALGMLKQHPSTGHREESASDARDDPT